MRLVKLKQRLYNPGDAHYVTINDGLEGLV